MNNPFLFETEEFGYESEFEDSFESFEDEYESEIRQRASSPMRPSRSNPRVRYPSRRPRPKKRRFPAAFPLPYSYPSYEPVQAGSECVKLVQSLLNRLMGLNLPTDGIMGMETRSAIRDFQNQRYEPASAKSQPDGAEPADSGAAPPASDGDQGSEEYDFYEFYDNEAEYFEFEEEINRSSAEYAKWIQQSLNRVNGAGLVVDGIIGPLSRSAIRSFQSKKGLEVDGIVGPITEAALIKAGASQPPGSSISPPPYGPPTTGGVPSGSPVSGGRITSPFGYRIHPISGERKLHKGTDIGGLPVGSTVSATAAGTVIFAANSGCSGNMVKVDHGNGYITYYLHLNRISVSNGQSVSRGQKVGELGQTGCVTGPHVHYEVHRNGTAIDPAPFL